MNAPLHRVKMAALVVTASTHSHATVQEQDLMEKHVKTVSN